MKKTIIALIPLGLFLLMVGLVLVPLFEGKDPSILPSAMLDKPAPEFSLPAAEDGGEGLSLQDLQGAVTVVNFFASWCLPCAAEQKILAQLAAEEKVPVYGIAYKDRRSWLKDWLARTGNPFIKIGFDESGRAAIDWGVYGVPETFVIDQSGIIRYKHVGPVTPNDYKNIFKPLLAELK